MRDKTQSTEKIKPKYNMWQNSCFMIKLCFKIKEKKVVFLTLLLAFLTVAKNLFDLYVTPAILSIIETQGNITDLLITVFYFVCGMMFVSGFISYINCNTLFGRVTVRSEILGMINIKASTTSYPNIYDKHFQDLLAKSAEATSDNSSGTEAIWDTLTTITTNILCFLIYLNLLVKIDMILLIIIFITTVLGYFITKRLYEYEYQHRDEQAEITEKIFYINQVSRDVAIAKDIRIFGLRGWLEELQNKSMGAYTAFCRKAESVYVWAKITDLLLAFLRNGIAYWYLIGLVFTQSISVAEFLLLFSAVGGFTEWITGILGNLNTLHKQSLDISTIRECLEFPEQFLFNTGKPLSPQDNTNYVIKLENVSFRYPDSDKDTLTNINLTLRSGEKLAVVGLNGAGKTTLVKLICGFLDPTEGRVLLNDVDIRTYNRKDYYTMFSAVFQNFSLLAGTVATNVAQSDESIDMARVKDCIEKAGLRTKIESLPKQYETYLNRDVYEDAIMLSGGEMQRLMLARALYKNASFVILDEPTAALDPIAESDMYQKYNEMTQGKSSLYISHRLASTQFCDRIILIENSVISEEGTHKQLLDKGGRYTELFNVQSKYYKEEENNEQP